MPDHFNYISFGNVDYLTRPDGSIEMSRGRMFEYTPTELEKRLEALDVQSQRYLAALPTFLCSEAYRSDDRIAMIVKFGRVIQIGVDARSVSAIFRTQFDFGEVTFDNLDAAVAIFEADAYELYRTHWAVREGAAHNILQKLHAITQTLPQPAADAEENGREGIAAEPPPRMKRTLGKVRSVEGFLRVLGRTASKEENETFFRGHSDAAFELTPSVLRKNSKGGWKYLPWEDRLCKELLIAHYGEFQGDQSTFDKLVRMQHYGLPTRLLDITTNPLMALYFACAEATDKDGEVILFSMARAKVKYYDSDAISCISNLSQLTYGQKNEIDLHLDLKPFNESPPIRKLLHHIKSEKGYFEARIIAKDLDSIVCVKAKQTNSRIRSQSGAFLLFGLESTLPDTGSEDIDIERITIQNKEHIREELDRLNINAMTAYPSIDQTAERLKKLYSSEGSVTVI